MSTHWTGDSRRALTLKAVVSSTGHTVAKNYDTAKLRPGDLGLRMALDRAKIEEMTPEQRSAAQIAGQAMATDFLSALGIEQEAGFPPGTVVEVRPERTSDFYAFVVKDSGDVVHLKKLAKGQKLVRTTVSVHRCTVEEVHGYQGYEGLALVVASTNDANWVPVQSFEGNEEFLAQLAKAYNAQVQLRAVQLITDELILLELLFWEEEQRDDDGDITAIYGLYEAARLEAVHRIKEPDTLAKVIKYTEQAEYVVLAAIEKVSDPADLATAVRIWSEFDKEDILTALLTRLEELGETDLLRELVLGEDVPDKLFQAACQAVNDQDILFALLDLEMARSTRFIDQELLRRLEDVNKLLERFNTLRSAKEERHASYVANRLVELDAGDRISDPQILRWIVNNEFAHSHKAATYARLRLAKLEGEEA